MMVQLIEQKIQQEDLVGLSEIMKFLKKHITKTYEDVCVD